MSEHGAALQTYNQELVKSLEQLKVRRNDIQAVIAQEESDRAILDRNIKTLQEKLAKVNESLAYHQKLKNGYDKTIQDVEIGFKKILESSQTLLNLAQHEVNKLGNSNKTES